MTTRNTYATLNEFKAYRTARKQVSDIDTADDAVIEQLLESASRYIDSKTARFFYPRIETRNYSIPYGYGRELDFGADVLAIITLLNGDGTSIASTNYNLYPTNETPKYALGVKITSTLTWELDSDGESENVLDLTALLGFHNRYADAWKAVTTLSEALDTTEVDFDVANSQPFEAGQIIKIDNELFIEQSKNGATISVTARGANGSTAAAHSTSAPVYIWQPMEEARNAVCEIANNAYRRRFGQSTGGAETITAAGVVLSPRDIPAMAEEFIKTYQRRVY